jgi:hypothetical protein
LVLERTEQAATTRGAAKIIVNRDKTGVRDYLLGRVTEADEEQFELRLLSDPAFGEEFDTVVDEITDDYLENQLSDDERERVEKYFLSTTERRNKLEFAVELLRRAESERGTKVKESRASLFEQISAFWKRQSFAQVAMMAAAVIIVAGLFYVLTRDNANYLALNLENSAAERDQGAVTKPVKLPPNTGLKITLTIPESARGAKDYVAQLANGTGLEIESRTEKTVTVKVRPALLKPGTDAIQLSKVKPDNTPERILGNYYFAVE